MATANKSPDSNTLFAALQRDLAQLNPASTDYATQVVDLIMDAALRLSATDIHISQQQHNLETRFRVYGTLLDPISFEDGEQSKVNARIKALARMITYRCDLPQEGRMVISSNQGGTELKTKHLEARVGSLPTLHGERMVIRLAKRESVHWRVNQLGLPAAASNRLEQVLLADSGVVLITGPAGSGKTTTAYACLREVLARQVRRSIVTLEDPVEQELVGVAQSQINPANDYTWSSGLKALLRQDPEVMLVGEIRDAETAEVVFQAAMTGQLVVTTMHARTAADALRRLLDMGVPVHHLRSSLDYLSCQRLSPRSCACQNNRTTDDECETCHGIGTCGYQLLAEVLPEVAGELSQTLTEDASTAALQSVAQSLGMTSLDALTQQFAAQGTIRPRP